MNKSEAWKNFNLGEELSVAGAFIYNGLRRFHEMRTLDLADEIFEVFYNLSVGLERLLKIAVVLLEHTDASDQEELERSLVTHNHLDLLKRVTKKTKLNIGNPHNDFLALLGTFYNSIRYDRFTLASVYDPDKEKTVLWQFLSKHLGEQLRKSDSIFATQNKDRYRKFLRGLVVKISSELFEVIRERAGALNLYTYELRHGSKAETIFLGRAQIPTEDVLWKELLIFLMNTKTSSGYLKFMRSIEPLGFDPALVGEYLDCFQSDAAKAFVMDELEHLYEEEVKDTKERLEIMNLIGNPNAYFDEEEEDDNSGL